MKRLLTLVTLLAAAACSSDSEFPTPTGKGTVRGLNAIASSPATAFLIEEVTIGDMSFRDTTPPQRYDDFEYLFNAELVLPGDTTTTRVASLRQKIETDRDHTFVLTGQWDAPAITVWTATDPLWEGTETVFEMRFAHLAAGAGAVDVYFAAEGVTPVLGQEQGTLNFGEILDPIEFSAGDFIVTYTASGDPADVLYQSGTTSYQNANTFIAPLFVANEQDTSPFIVSLINSDGGSVLLDDPRFPPTAKFFHADMSLGPSDVYDDEMLTNAILTNHLFGDISGDIEITDATATFTYTPAGNPGAVSLTTELTPAPGARYNIVALNGDPERLSNSYIPDRTSISSIAKFSFFHAAFNHATIDLYVVERGQGIADAVPTAADVNYPQLIGSLGFNAGAYDLYLTNTGEETLIAGPVALDLALGDVFEIIALDTVDPATAELRIAP